MKRAFLFGGSFSLIAIPIGLLWLGGDVARLTKSESIAVGVFALIAGVIVLRAARQTTPSPSWLVAITGWVLGFYAFPAMIGVLLAIGDKFIFPLFSN